MMRKDGPSTTDSDKNRMFINIACAVLLAVYSVFMFYLMFFKNRPKTVNTPVVFGVDIKLVPFVTTQEFIEILRSPQSERALRHAIRNLAGNVFLFVPYGFFLPYFSEKCRKYGKTLLFSALGITVIELTQLMTRRGICDVDDLILNLIGISLGFALFALWRGYIRGSGKQQHTI